MKTWSIASRIFFQDVKSHDWGQMKQYLFGVELQKKSCSFLAVFGRGPSARNSSTNNLSSVIKTICDTMHPHDWTLNVWFSANASVLARCSFGFINLGNKKFTGFNSARNLSEHHKTTFLPTGWLQFGLLKQNLTGIGCPSLARTKLMSWKEPFNASPSSVRLWLHFRQIDPLHRTRIHQFHHSFSDPESDTHQQRAF